MLHLSRHIEYLLTEYNCVVIPGFGGFISHEISAVWNREEKIFFPPTRVLGFNPQLKMNDGLLAQSYMKASGATYVEACEALEKDVKKLIEALRREGKADLPHIGCISRSANNIYDFVSYDNELISPAYYGLDSFEIKELTTLLEENNIAEKKKRKKIRYPLFLNPVLKNTAAIAAILILCFLMSTPIENTAVPDENYAYILPTELFNKIRKESLITTPVVNPVTSTDQSTVKPVATKEIRVPQPEVKEAAPVKETPAEDYKYHLIVASVTKENEGSSMVEKLHAKGYKGARIITGDGRIRVSIASYTTREEATKELFQLREIEAYQNAWLLNQ